MRVTAEHLDQVLHPQFAGEGQGASPRASAASPGAAVGKVYFTADDAADAAERGEQVILVRSETSPEDVHGMMVGRGHPHRARRPRQPRRRRRPRLGHAGRRRRRRGEDRRQAVHRRRHRRAARATSSRSTAPPARSCSARSQLVGGRAAGGVRHDPRVGRRDPQGQARRCGPTPTPARTPPTPASSAPRASACAAPSTCSSATTACRSCARMILADTPDEEAAALEELRAACSRPTSRRSSRRWTGCRSRCACSTRRCTSSCPSVEELRDQAGDARARRDEEQPSSKAAEDWHEHNPMLGTRGVRLGVVKPGLYAMQVRALMEAAADACASGGKNPIVEMMIPLTVTREELALARGWVRGRRSTRRSKAHARSKPDVTIGTMIETPRAALRADEIAEEADFFSFGTNDLTQMTFGFSRLVASFVGLVLYHPQLADVIDLARAFPATPIVMGHVGGVLGYGPYAGKRDEEFAALEGVDGRAGAMPERRRQARRHDQSRRRVRFPHRRGPALVGGDRRESGGPMSRPASSCSAPSAACSRAISRSTRWRSATPRCGTRSSASPRAPRPTKSRRYSPAPPRAFYRLGESDEPGIGHAGHDHSRWGAGDQIGAGNLLTVERASPRCARCRAAGSTI